MEFRAITITPRVISGDPEPTVDARELHQALGIRKDFSSWVKYLIARYAFEKGSDFFSARARPSGPGRPAIEYTLSLATAMEIALVSNTPDGPQVRQHLSKQAQPPPLPITAPKMHSLAIQIKTCVISNDLKESTVDARELHKALGVGSKFTDWIKDLIAKYDFAEGSEFIRTFGNTPRPGRPSIEYTLSLGTAKEIAMVAASEKGRQVRRYFIDVEKNARNALIKQVSAVPAKTVAEFLVIRMADSMLPALIDEVQKQVHANSPDEREVIADVIEEARRQILEANDPAVIVEEVREQLRNLIPTLIFEIVAEVRKQVEATSPNERKVIALVIEEARRQIVEADQPALVVAEVRKQIQNLIPTLVFEIDDRVRKQIHAGLDPAERWRRANYELQQATIGLAAETEAAVATMDAKAASLALPEA